MAEKILMSEYKALAKEPWTNIEMINENIFQWNVALVPVNPDSLYYGGYFQAKMHFPKDYPYKPPTFRFTRSLLHPNVYDDGRLCISILHQPGEDAMSGELASERWSPAQRVESVLISILSLLDDPELSSPANVDASVMLRKDPAKYKALIDKDLEASRKDMPAGYVMPTSQTAYKAATDDVHDFSWSDSDAEDDFGGSDTDEEDMDLDGDLDSDSADDEVDEVDTD